MELYPILFVSFILLLLAVLKVYKFKASERFTQVAESVDEDRDNSPKYTLPVLVISLQGSPRREKIKEMFKHFPGSFVFIDGVRVRSNKDRLDQLKIVGLEPSGNSDPYIKGFGDFGCAMAHLRAYMFIVQQNFPYALILEDDVMIDGPHVFSKILDYHHPVDGHDYTFVQNVVAWGCGAQVVSNRAAHTLLANTDHVLRHPIDMAIIHNHVPDLDFGRGETWFHQSIEVNDPNTERGKMNKH